MPYAASKLCPRHPSIKLSGKHACPICKKIEKGKEAVRNKNRYAMGILIYKTARWQKLRLHKLALNPWCEECDKKGIVMVATDVDHIAPIVDGGAHYDLANLQSLCHACHSRKTVLENDIFKH